MIVLIFMERSNLINGIEEFMKERTAINREISLYKNRISEHLEKSELNINIENNQNISFSQPSRVSLESFVEGTNLELEKEKQVFVDKSTIFSDIKKKKMKIMMDIEKENKELTMKKRKELFEINKNSYLRRKELFLKIEELLNDCSDNEEVKETLELFNDCTQLNEKIMEVQNDIQQLLTDIDSKNANYFNYLNGIHNEKRKLLINENSSKNYYSFADIF